MSTNEIAILTIGLFSGTILGTLIGIGMYIFQIIGFTDEFKREDFKELYTDAIKIMFSLP